MKPRKHAELIKAWADGAEIEFRGSYTNYEWVDVPKNGFAWYDNLEYRIKSEQIPDCIVNYWYDEYFTIRSCVMQNPSLCLTFDGKTGKLKSAEVL